ncbi:MAG: DNA pilot protein [Microviridae sp.]|nr:MAG: DNA pilot protein [Microviridae sp.]
MDPLTGTLINVGGKLLGGLFGNRSAKKAAAKQRAQALEDERLKFTRLRESAELGGFNPLTALAGGGLSGLSGLPSSAPPLASTEMLSGALSDITDEFTGVASQQRARDQLELELAKIKVDQAKTELVHRQKPSAANNVAGGSGSANLGNNAASAIPPGTSVRMFGFNTKPSDLFSDAEIAEQRYSDVAGSILGVATLGADLWNTIPEPSADMIARNDARYGKGVKWADNSADDESKWSAFALREKYGVKPDGFNEAGKPYWLTASGFSTKPPARK